MLRLPLDRIIERFNMLWFIMALGLGGTSVAGFAFLNYVLPRPAGMKGLIHAGHVDALLPGLDPTMALLARALRAHLATFALLHLVALAAIFTLYFAWRRRHPEKGDELAADNTRNAVTVAPALALGMTFNIVLVGGYFFVPWVQENMQAIMPWGLGAWGILFLYTMVLTLRVQRAHLERGFDVLSMHFGWLLLPFALAMLGVSGAGLAALAKSAEVAKPAFFLSLIPFGAATFLLSVKLMSIFRSQYRKGLPERVEFLPSFLVVIPIVTLLSITLFRYGHFFEHHFGHVPAAYFAFVTGAGWAFQLWYLALGLMLLGSYLKQHLFQLRYFDESQWGLVCPLVALAVLGTFVYEALLPHPVVVALILLFLASDVLIVAWMAARQYLALAKSEAESGSEAAATPAE